MSQSYLCSMIQRHTRCMFNAVSLPKKTLDQSRFIGLMTTKSCDVSTTTNIMSTYKPSTTEQAAPTKIPSKQNGTQLTYSFHLTPTNATPPCELSAQLRDTSSPSLQASIQTYPSQYWDLLLPEAELTLSNLKPNISAHNHFHNTTFSYNAHPLGPLGATVLIHNKPAAHHTWDFRCQEGWYLGTSLENY